jgi:hypothetical protein
VGVPYNFSNPNESFVYDPGELWRFLPIGYLLTVAIETPILCLLLSRRHPVRDRIVAGFWLTAVTYPIVVITLPLLVGDLAIGPFSPRAVYLAIAETFAPAAEYGLFYLAYIRGLAASDRRATWRDMAAIVAANLASFGLGELEIFREFVRQLMPQWQLLFT